LQKEILGGVCPHSQAPPLCGGVSLFPSTPRPQTSLLRRSIHPLPQSNVSGSAIGLRYTMNKIFCPGALFYCNLLNLNCTSSACHRH